jgi:hypothetical protein
MHLLPALVLAVLPMAAQSPGIPMAGSGMPGSPRVDSDSGVESRMATKRIAKLNQIRQKAMVEDAVKILRLAEELNKDANAGGVNLSQAERMQKAAEIEKLAKQVREKMTYSIGEPSEVMGPFAAFPR